MFLVGLTGGIAAGKTTVAKRLVELGAIEIDADLLAREVVEPGSPGLAKVAEAFGESVIDSNGALDRTKLGEIVFSDSKKRTELESIVHPLVKELAKQRVASQAEDSVVIYTVPLLVEAEVNLPFDLVVTVEAPESAQVERMVKSRGLSAEQALARIRAQATAAQRANHADVILNSNQTIGRLIDDVDNLWQEINRLATKKQVG